MREPELRSQVEGVRLQLREAAADAALARLKGLSPEERRALMASIEEARAGAELREDLAELALDVLELAVRVAI